MTLRPATDYIALAPLSGGNGTSLTASRAASHTLAYLLRRRVLYVVLFGSALLSLFVILRGALHEIDMDIDLDEDLLDIDLMDLLPPNTFESLRTAYLPFRAPRTQVSHNVTLLPVRELSEECVEAYFSEGAPCGVSGGQPKLDFLWTWVNGSDPLEDQAKKAAQAAFGPTDPWRPAASGTQARMYRDHDELRHSLRSVLANFRGYAGRFFLLTADFPLPTTTPNLTQALPPGWRLGQIPQWLDIEARTAWVDGDVGLQVVHHAQVFQPYLGTNFNSLAIESQLGHVDAISDHFVYMNDDLYMMSAMNPASFYTPAYGVVIYLQSDLMVAPTRPNAKTQGEWRSMGESNYILSERFGQRHRPYVVHEAKSVSRPLLAEAAAIWPTAFARSATHAFRETAGPGTPSDVNTMFLHAHMLVERAREALLWTWVVAHVGTLDDGWGDAEARQAWAELGGAWDVPEGGKREVEVRAGRRTTLERERVMTMLAQAGVPEGLGKTAYVFSSSDGYAYATLGTRGQQKWPAFTPDAPEDKLPSCRISFRQCFPGHSRASEVFKHIAFRELQCGDCIISALMRTSGPLGLSTFLPSPDRALGSLAGKLPSLPFGLSFPGAGSASPGDELTVVPHLPLVDKWENGAFALRDVMGATGERNVRRWTLSLLQRYRYVIATTPAIFERLQSPRQAASMLARVDRNKEAALLCINDDVVSGDAEVAKTFREWQDKHWGTRAKWEKS